ncbi:MAG TPA: glycosyltransferase [Sphingomicrobium sp.]|nr:glycosyltransferase [Sphingomicrobium sp.]
MGTPPLVTVVIPTWNRLELLQEAIASVVAQTCPNWELIVVDDGSTDGTPAHLRAISDPRIRAIAVDRLGKVGHLRNIGAAAGTAGWIAFLDSDDLWMPDKLEIQLEALEASGADWCYGQCELLNPNGETLPIRAGRFRPISGKIVDDLLADRTGAYIGTVLVRRDLFESLGGFDESLPNREDLDFELRLAAGAKAVAVSRIVTRVREHEGRRTRLLSTPHEESALIFERFRKRHPRGRSERLARRREARLLAEAGAQRIADHQYAKGAHLLLRALMLGVPPGFWVRSAAGGLRKSIAVKRF